MTITGAFHFGEQRDPDTRLQVALFMSRILRPVAILAFTAGILLGQEAPLRYSPMPSFRVLSPASPKENCRKRKQHSLKLRN